MSDAIYTIGHSTRPLDKFIALLKAHGIAQLADVRSVPRSRRHPHFSMEALSESLPQVGVTYRHFRSLGGLRKPRPDSRNTAWRHGGFRGYADYMETPEFDSALDELLMFAGMPRGHSVADTGGGEAPRAVINGARAFLQGEPPRTVIMCAEAVWWRCHRQLIADALVARGVEVRHIGSPSAAPAHALRDFVHVDGDRVVYRRLI